LTNESRRYKEAQNIARRTTAVDCNISAIIYSAIKKT